MVLVLTSMEMGWCFRGKHGKQGSWGVPTFPYPPSPISHHWTSASRGNYLGDFWNYCHCLVSTRQPQNSELSTLAYKPEWKVTTGCANPSWERDGLGWFIFTQDPAARYRVALTISLWFCHLHFSLFIFSASTCPMRWVMLTKLA